MTGTEIYKRTETYEREASTIRLHAPQWKLLLAYDGQRSLAEVALSADVPFAEALPLTEKFLEHKWIAEQPITLEQYLKRTGAPSVSAIGAAVPPAVILHAPKPETAAPPPPLPVTPSPVVTPPSPPTPIVVKTGTVPLPPVSETVPPQKIPSGPLRMSALVDFLISLTDNRSLGQILAYQVFLRVQPELLQAENIASVHLMDDTNLIRTEPLKQAIADAVRAVAKASIPDSAFIPA